jgi:hypothetical protein
VLDVCVLSLLRGVELRILDWVEMKGHGGICVSMDDEICGCRQEYVLL